MGINSLSRWGFLAAALLLVFEVRATAIRIDIDTDALALNGSNWDLTFDLIRGDPGTPLNVAVISNFAITGGSLTGTPTFFPNSGNVTGALPGNVTLDTGDVANPSFFNEYGANADLGSSISFILDISDNELAGVTPDAFAFFFVDPTDGSTFPTADPSGALFVFNVGEDDQPVTFCPVTAPCVAITPIVVAVPEPGALVLVLAALLARGLAGSAGRKRSSRAIAA